MTATLPAPAVTTESAWKSYLKATVFLLPALVIWGFALHFLYPKVQHLWVRAASVSGADTASAQVVMDTITVLVQNGGTIMTGLVVALLLLEVGIRSWARYRKFTLGSLVFVLNTLVLVGLTAMCLIAIITAVVNLPR
jgi:hypothetical protein